MRPVLGEFLDAAGADIRAATGEHPAMPTEAAQAVIRQVARITAMMSRCADAFAVDGQSGTGPAPDARDLAVLDARAALRHAAARMRLAADLPGTSTGAGHPAARRLSAAADSLAAGHDLLQTHFAPGPDGRRHESSPWAPAIVSAPVTAALVTEMSRHAGRLAPWVLHLSAGPPSQGLPAPARTALHSACQWLHAAETATWAAAQRADTQAENALLHAIPANVCPPRLPPRDGEPVPELCMGVIAASERLRYLAHHAIASPGKARIGVALSCQRTARAAAIAGHCTQLILRQLTAAGGCPQRPARRSSRQPPRATAPGMAWQAIAQQWDTITTAPGPLVTPVATEIDDLTLRMGRLAYTDPTWTPARTQAKPAHLAAALASDTPTITSLVRALHHVSDALAHIAAGDQQHLSAAATKRDLYIPTRLLPNAYKIRYRYLPIGPARANPLVTAYDDTIQAAAAAATTFDTLALTLDPQPTVLTTRRAIARVATPSPAAVPVLPASRRTIRAAPGSLEQSLHRRGIDDPALLARAADIDHATRDLIHATTPPEQRQATANHATLKAFTRSLHGHPTRLAAQDSPPIAKSNTPLPRLIPVNRQIRHSITRHRPAL